MVHQVVIFIVCSLKCNASLGKRNREKKAKKKAKLRKNERNYRKKRTLDMQKAIDGKQKKY